MKCYRTYRLITDAQGAAEVITPFLKGWFLHKLEFENPTAADKLYSGARLTVYTHERGAERKLIFQGDADISEVPFRMGEIYTAWNGTTMKASTQYWQDVQPERLKIAIVRNSGTAAADKYIDATVILSTNEAGCSSDAGLPEGFK